MVRKSNSRKKRTTSRRYPKGEPHERNLCALMFEERTPVETSRQEECAREAAWSLARNMFKLKAEDKATFCSPVKIKAPVLVSKNTEERVLVVDSGASMHMQSKKDLSSDEMETLRVFRTPTTVVTAMGKCRQTRRHKCTFKISICSSLCNDSKKRSEHGCSFKWKKRRNSNIGQ